MYPGSAMINVSMSYMQQSIIWGNREVCYICIWGWKSTVNFRDVHNFTHHAVYALLCGLP